MFKVKVMIMEIQGVRFYQASVMVVKDDKYQNINMNVNVEKVEKGRGEIIELDFSFKSSYEPQIAQLLLRGKLYMKATAKEYKDLTEALKNKKGLPVEMASLISTAITYAGEVNGTLLARIVNIPAPIIPPSMTYVKKSM